MGERGREAHLGRGEAIGGGDGGGEVQEPVDPRVGVGVVWVGEPVQDGEDNVGGGEGGGGARRQGLRGVLEIVGVGCRLGSPLALLRFARRHSPPRRPPGGPW
jgi:hypothetical protein